MEYIFWRECIHEADAILSRRRLLPGTGIPWKIKINLLLRIMAVKLDDVFYGRKPRSSVLPAWLTYTTYK